MPKKKVAAKKSMIMRNQFFGMLLIAFAVGALIVFVRYIVITLAAPADIYLIQPGQLIPGMAN